MSMCVRACVCLRQHMSVSGVRMQCVCTYLFECNQAWLVTVSILF